MNTNRTTNSRPSTRGDRLFRCRRITLAMASLAVTALRALQAGGPAPGPARAPASGEATAPAKFSSADPLHRSISIDGLDYLAGSNQHCSRQAIIR
ncbi:hypothetical protein [Desulfosarcina alkanivorans]|uniref:hypothetical protein n=1 Tax=Desulfosarcina alkanivorans TaxID=571177 RepID=UPI0012D31CB4|nr:hypothetical protein [Desulfosarcina alkanivorans]